MNTLDPSWTHIKNDKMTIPSVWYETTIAKYLKQCLITEQDANVPHPSQRKKMFQTKAYKQTYEYTITLIKIKPLVIEKNNYRLLRQNTREYSHSLSFDQYAIQSNFIYVEHAVTLEFPYKINSILKYSLRLLDTVW